MLHLIGTITYEQKHSRNVVVTFRRTRIAPKLGLELKV